MERRADINEGRGRLPKREEPQLRIEWDGRVEGRCREIFCGWKTSKDALSEDAYEQIIEHSLTRGHNVLLKLIPM